MQIRILTGAYGLSAGNTVELKDKNSEPFVIDDTEGKRLIALGIAEAVATTQIAAEKSNKTNDNPKSKTAKKGNSAKNRATHKEDSVMLTAEMPE